MLPELDLSEFQYDLPENRIAQFPLEARDHSKLLLYKAGSITHNTFKDLPKLIPANSTLILNDTQVIPARMIFRKETGAAIEIFLLSPLKPTMEMQSAMNSQGSCTWTCMIGNQKRWKEGQILKQSLNLDNQKVEVKASQNNDPAGNLLLGSGSYPL